MPNESKTEWFIYPDSIEVGKQIACMLPADAERPQMLCADGMVRDLLVCERDLMDHLRNDRVRGTNIQFKAFKSVDGGKPHEVFKLQKGSGLKLVNHGDPPGAYRKTG